MSKIVVFGGAGFLGGYLVEELVERGYNILAVDIADEFPLPINVDYLRCDIMDHKSVNKVITEEVSTVYNLAGFANLERAINHPYDTMNLNVMGNINILNACQDKRINRYVYASSAYAMNDKGSFYGISKLTSEKVIEEYENRYGIPFTILRYGSVYSERDFDNNYIYQLVEKAIKTGEIIHGGDGEEIREYIHAHDAAVLSVDVIESENFKNQQVVLTGVEKMKRHELFLMIKEILDNDLKIVLKNDGYSNHYKFTPYSFEPSVSKKLVANPHIDMGQGLLRCIKAAYNAHS